MTREPRQQQQDFRFFCPEGERGGNSLQQIIDAKSECVDWNAICRSDTVKGSLPDRQKGPADLSVLQRLSDGYCFAVIVLQ